MAAERILVLGAASLVGSHFVGASGPSEPIVAAGRTDPRTLGLAVTEFRPVSLSDESAVRQLVRTVAPRLIVNFAARTDVDGCEKERPPVDGSDGGAVAESARRLNAELPGWLAEEATEASSRLVHISTDYVFDGTAGPYPETAAASPLGPRLSWYGFTKGIGERAVLERAAESSIVRIAHPYRARFSRKLDFARTIVERAAAGTLPSLYTDQVITPTWIPDVTEAVHRLVQRPRPGIQHVASPDPTSPFEFARATLQAVGSDPSVVMPSTLGSGPAPAGRAPRPLRGGLTIDPIRSGGSTPTTFREGLRQLADQIGRTGRS